MHKKVTRYAALGFALAMLGRLRFRLRQRRRAPRHPQRRRARRRLEARPQPRQVAPLPVAPAAS